jgi:hypothetical protein
LKFLYPKGFRPKETNEIIEAAMLSVKNLKKFTVDEKNRLEKEPLEESQFGVKNQPIGTGNFYGNNKIVPEDINLNSNG